MDNFAIIVSKLQEVRWLLPTPILSFQRPIVAINESIGVGRGKSEHPSLFYDKDAKDSREMRPEVTYFLRAL